MVPPIPDLPRDEIDPVGGAPRLPRGSRIAFTLALLMALFALLTLVRLPIGALWLPTLVVSTWGHFFALICLGCAGVGLVLRRRRRHSSPLGLATILLLVGAAIAGSTPLTRQRISAGDLSARLAASFGESAPREAEGAAARGALIVPAQWFGFAAPEVEVQTLKFCHRRDGPLELDLYRRPGLATPLPLVVMVHGGSWLRGERSEFSALDRYLAARGYAVADVDYRLAPEHRFPAPVEDLHAALEYLVRESETLGLDPHQITLIGRSAGGHLALAAAYTSTIAVRGVVAFYAPTDMVWSWEKSTDLTYLDGKAVVETLMGAPPEGDPAGYRAASPLFLATEMSPPTLLFHGARDRLVSPEQSTRLSHRLDELGVPNLHLELPGATHGFDASFAAPGAQISTFAIERFLASVCRE